MFFFILTSEIQLSFYLQSAQARDYVLYWVLLIQIKKKIEALKPVLCNNFVTEVDKQWRNYLNIKYSCNFVNQYQLCEIEKRFNHYILVYQC